MTLIVVGYTSKKELKAAVGKPLQYEETSMFGAEYKADGSFSVAHRPALNGSPGREFFARVTMKNAIEAEILLANLEANLDEEVAFTRAIVEKQASKNKLSDYWAGSVSASVLNDYKTGKVVDV